MGSLASWGPLSRGGRTYSKSRSFIYIELAWSQPRGEGKDVVTLRCTPARGNPGRAVHTELTRTVVEHLLRETTMRQLPPGDPDLRALDEVFSLPEIRTGLSRELDQDTGCVVRLVLSAPGARELLALPWELARLPAYASGRFAHADSAGPICRHSQVTLARYLHAEQADDPPRHRWGPIVASSATSVEGHVVTPRGTRRLSSAAWAGDELELLRDALGDYAGDLVWTGEPTNEEALRSALSERAFGFYFGGHHVDDGIVLASNHSPDVAVWVPVPDLAGRLAEAQVVVAVLVACRGAEPLQGGVPGGDAGAKPADPGPHMGEMLVGSSTAERLVEAGVPFAVAMRGDVSDAAARRFTHEFFHLLAQRAPIDRAMADAASKAEVDGEFFTPVLYTSWLSDDLAVAEAAPPTLPGLRAYRIPAQWRPEGGACPVGDAHLADLGAWLCLDRGASTCVVAARSGTRLAEALNAVERGAINHGRGAVQEFPERAWHDVDANAADRELSALQTDTAAPALVVTWPVGVYRSGWTGGRSARDVHDRIRAALPDAPVVVLVQAEQAFDAIAAAADVARDLGAGVRGAPIDVLAHVRPGEPDKWPPGPAPRGDANLVANRLMAGIIAQFRARSLPIPPYPEQDAPLEGDADPVGVAAKVVEALEQSAPWGPPICEAQALSLIRDQAPRYFLPLLQRHASHRAGPARWASFHAAMTFDDYVDAWLDAAPEASEPARVPRDLRDGRLIEAVLLGLLRRGEDGIGPWLHAARYRCDAAWQVAQHVAARDLGADFFQRASAEVGIAAIRAGAGNPLITDLKAPEASAAWWAAVGRSPLTERTVTKLAGMSTESRRVAGFTAERDEPDPDFAELAYQMRTAMRPPLPMWENDKK